MPPAQCLARLMLGSLPREESAVQPAVRSESFAEQGTMLEEMDADYPETGVELERGIPAAEAAWMAGLLPGNGWSGNPAPPNSPPECCNQANCRKCRDLR